MKINYLSVCEMCISEIKEPEDNDGSQSRPQKQQRILWLPK